MNAFIVASAAIQDISALAIVYLTWKLAEATKRYAETTDELLKLDWRPDLRIASIDAIGVDVFLRIANLANPAALVKQLKIGTGGRLRMNQPPQDVEAYSLPLLVGGGEVVEHHNTIQSFLGKYRQKYNPPRGPGQDTWQVGMSIALVYDSGGKENQTPWFDCMVTFSGITAAGVQAGI